ncbi:hypothetical protein KC946_00435 [Candidatus Saccharibacteria bacterium]|nr:hypothetical protein [Candidatus Saccharibacteria bacterium]
MELSQSKAQEILKTNKIAVSPEDFRSSVEIATQFVLTGQVAINPLEEQRTENIDDINIIDQNIQ